MLNKIMLKVFFGIGIAGVVFMSLSYVHDNMRDSIYKEQQIEQIQKEVEIRKKVENALQENYKLNPDRSGDIALDRLCKRYGREDC